MSVRDEFVKRFDERCATRIEQAAEGHKNGVHDKKGSDPFKWALAICIGYQCLGKYAKYHEIYYEEQELKDWIRENAGLAEHDGDVDYLGVFAGAYDGWYKKGEDEKEEAS